MLVLASRSPRRQELLLAAGIPFLLRASEVPEERQAGETAEAYVRRLAASKAQSVELYPGEYVLGADTVVVLGDEVLEKPSDEEDAARMLRLLSGREHRVLTGICLRSAERVLVDHAETLVRFHAMDEDEVQSYVNSGEPMDKAGAYAIQGIASRYIERIEGCYSNVVGLPVSLLYRRLRELSGE